MEMSRYQNTWEAYQSAWSDIPTDERRRILSRSVADDCVYSDPTDLCHGVDELITHIEGSQKKVPGARFRNDKLLVHHDQAMSNWTMFDGNGATVATGTSYARFRGDGRLVQMTGFFEPKTS